MKTRNLVAVAGCLLFGACVPSVNPFYTENDLVFEPRLVGEWQSKDASDRETWKFEKAGDDKAYKLVVTQKDGKHGELAAHLFKIKNDLFLDIMPTDCEFAGDQADIVAAAMFPGHLLMKVPQMDLTLSLAFCDYDWLGKYLEEHDNALAFHKEEKGAVLTASTKDLQAFMAQHLSELFQSPKEFERKEAK